MRAFVYERYGPPDVLRLREVEKPVPAEDELLVRVHAASVNPFEYVTPREAGAVAKKPANVSFEDRLKPRGKGLRGEDEGAG